MSEWISVKDRLPKKGELCITWDGRGIDALYFDEVKEDGTVVFLLQGVYYTVDIENVTHWQPLPEPPEVNND